MALRNHYSLNISGTIPAEWASLTALTWYDMDSQPISGTIGSFSTMTSLNYINFAETLISGTVTNLAHLTTLEQL